MAVLSTPTDVMAAVGVNALGNYYEPIALDDAAGFSVKRNYPLGSALASILTRNGNQNLCCLIHFSVNLPKVGTGVSAVMIGTQMYARWERTHDVHLRRRLF